MVNSCTQNWKSCCHNNDWKQNGQNCAHQWIRLGFEVGLGSNPNPLHWWAQFAHFISSRCYITTIFNFAYMNLPYNLGRDRPKPISDIDFRRKITIAWNWHRENKYASNRSPTSHRSTWTYSDKTLYSMISWSHEAARSVIEMFSY